MPVSIDSTRFGTIEIQDEAVIQFPNGLIGLTGKRYALVAREENGAFQWLHSLDDPSLAIPVTNPFVFFQSYEVEISSAEADRIGISEPEQADVYVTVRAGEQLEDFRANLRAPILITAGRGYQVINEASDAPVRAPLFDQVALEQVA